MTYHYSMCPVVRDGNMQLFSRPLVAGEERWMPFVKRILWLRESEASLVLRHRGVKVDDLSRLNDWYGYLTSIESAIKETTKAAARLRIKHKDALTIDVDLVISETPVRVDESVDGIAWNLRADRKKYLHVPIWSDNGGKWYTSNEPGQDGAHQWLESKTLDSFTAIYSTGKDRIGKIPPRVATLIEKMRSIAIPIQSPGATQ